MASNLKEWLGRARVAHFDIGVPRDPDIEAGQAEGALLTHYLSARQEYIISAGRRDNYVIIGGTLIGLIFGNHFANIPPDLGSAVSAGAAAEIAARTEDLRGFLLAIPLVSVCFALLFANADIHVAHQQHWFRTKYHDALHRIGFGDIPHWDYFDQHKGSSGLKFLFRILISRHFSVVLLNTTVFYMAWTLFVGIGPMKLFDNGNIADAILAVWKHLRSTPLIIDIIFTASFVMSTVFIMLPGWVRLRHLGDIK